MTHHEPGPLCKLCEEKILEGHRLIQSSWSKIKKQFPKAHISWCFRNEEEQDKCFQEGASRKQWPNSKHNNRIGHIPCSLAIDLFRMDEQGQATFPSSFYAAISDFIDNSRFLPLEWSGKWKEFRELDHFELMEGMV